MGLNRGRKAQVILAAFVAVGVVGTLWSPYFGRLPDLATSAPSHFGSSSEPTFDWFAVSAINKSPMEL